MTTQLQPYDQESTLRDPPLLDRMKRIFALIEYRDWQWELDQQGADVMLRIRFNDDDGMPWTSRRWVLSRHMTPSEVVQTAWLAVQTAEMHEARERFKYRGKNPFGPHFNVEALVHLDEAREYDLRPPR